MIFKQIERIKTGRKTQTRRVKKDNEYRRWHNERISVCTLVWDNENFEPRPRAKWQVGKHYAVVPKRGQAGVGFIRIMDIRYECLQDITHEDALAEGVNSVEEYRTLWDSINKRKGTRWEDNPMVWVITFKYVGEVNDG